MFQWDDLRVFLAVADQGTTLGAARLLGLSQSTVSRRIAALEAALSLRLFDKSPQGYGLTAAGTALLDPARATAAAAEGFGHSAAGVERGLTGTVRLTTNEAFAQNFISRAVAQFRREFPQIQVELIASDSFLDIASGAADVALRAGPTPTAGGLVGRRIATDTWSIWCTRAYAEAHGMPKNGAELADHPFIGISRDYPRVPLALWLEEMVPPERIVVRLNSITGMFSSLRSGVGVAPMSDYLAESDASLVRCFVPPVPSIAEIWLLTHERLRHELRVRALLDFLAGWFTSGRHKA